MTASRIPAEEREIVVVQGEKDVVVRFETSIRRYITRLRKCPDVREIRTVRVGSSEEVTFEIPAGRWDPVSGVKRRRAPLSEEQRAVLVARLARSREEAPGA